MTNTSNASTPKRHEVPVEMTWDLTPIYADETAWEADFLRQESQISGFEAFQNQLSSPQSLLQCLQFRDETSQQIGRLYSWSSLRKAEDNADSTNQARYDRMQGLWARRAAATAFIEPEILAIAAENLQEMLEKEAGLQLYEYYFETLERRRPHTRTGEVEEVLAQFSETMGASEAAFRMFDYADLKFPLVHDENGAETELTHGKYINFLQSRDRRVRQEAFQTMHGEYLKWRNTLAATLGGAVKAHVAAAKIRHYPSVLHAELGPDAIPVAVYHNLISTVRERLPVLHRYLRLRKKLLGLEELEMWDLYVPMIEGVERSIPFDEGRRIVTEAAKPLGEQVGGILEEGFASRWIDV